VTGVVFAAALALRGRPMSPGHLMLQYFPFVFMDRRLRQSVINSFPQRQLRADGPLNRATTPTSLRRRSGPVHTILNVGSGSAQLVWSPVECAGTLAAQSGHSGITSKSSSFARS